ncbi:MAG: DUF4190 domain-containing protein [Planctomycetaceae bacterium]
MTPAKPDNDNDPAWYLSQPGNQGFQPSGNEPPGNDWNPYQASWTQSNSLNVQSQAVSALSILSMISGIISVPMICLCFLSIPFSLFAIVSGHISRSICRRSQGRVTGDGMAVAGLVLGYLTLLVTTGSWVAWFVAFASVSTSAPGPPAPPIMTPPAMSQSNATQQLDQAIAMASLSLSAGNSEEATALALHLQASLHDIAQQLQAGRLPVGDGSEEPNPAAAAESPTIVAELPETPGSIELQQALAESSVYCELRDDSCAFLVVIRNWAVLNDADRNTLSQMIWLAAGRSVKDHGNEGDEFALALVSDGLLVEISLGHQERSDYFDAGLEHRGPPDDETRLALEEFFEPAQAEAMPDTVDSEAAAQ